MGGHCQMLVDEPCTGMPANDVGTLECCDRGRAEIELGDDPADHQPKS